MCKFIKQNKLPQWNKYYNAIVGIFSHIAIHGFSYKSHFYCLCHVFTDYIIYVHSVCA